MELFEQIKMKKNLKFVTFKLTDDKKVIVPELQGPKENTYDDFIAALPSEEPRYAVVDVDFETSDGRPQSKLCFFYWSPDDFASVKQRMVYSSSKDALRKKMNGIGKEIQANDQGDLLWDSIKAELQR